MLSMTLRRSIHAVALMAEAVGQDRLARGAGGWRLRAERARRACARGVELLDIALLRWGRFPKHPSVIVAPQTSLLDAVVLGALLPSISVADADLRRWPLVGPLCASLGALFVERGSIASGARALRSARAALDDGVSVIGFPQRASSTSLSRGLFGLAALHGVPVLPVTLRYSGGDVAASGAPPLAQWLRIASAPDLRVTVTVGEPLRRAEGQPLDGFIDQARLQWETMLAPTVPRARFAA